MITSLVAGLLAGYGIAIPVGAVTAYLVALTARTSLKIGACAALGTATADGLYALIAVVGGSTLAGTVRPIVLPLRWASGFVVIALAIRGGATAFSQYRRRKVASRADEGAPIGPARAYMGLWGITMMNPTTVIYFAALVLGSQTAAAPDHLEQAVFVLAAFGASASWQLLIAGGGALLGRAPTGSGGRLVTAMVSSTLIIVLGLRLLLSAP